MVANDVGCMKLVTGLCDCGHFYSKLLSLIMQAIDGGHAQGIDWKRLESNLPLLGPYFVDSQRDLQSMDDEFASLEGMAYHAKRLIKRFAKCTPGDSKAEVKRRIETANDLDMRNLWKVAVHLKDNEIKVEFTEKVAGGILH